MHVRDVECCAAECEAQDVLPELVTSGKNGKIGGRRVIWVQLHATNCQGFDGVGASEANVWGLRDNVSEYLYTNLGRESH